MTIGIAADGTLDITERIRVTAAHQKIKRGIYRDFVKRSREHLGIPRLHPFELVSVSRDGAAEPYHWEGDRLYIGHRNTRVTTGEHVYAIRYRTGGWLTFPGDEDRLYWNVTGNDWDFPIERARVAIAVPGSPPHGALKVEGWSGPRGSTAQEWREVGYEDGVLTLATTARLAPQKGFSVSVIWPAGAVAPRSRSSVLGTLVGHPPSLVALLGTVLALVLYLYLWHRFGRDPAPGEVYTREDPPAGVSPGLARWLCRQRWDDTCLVAVLVDLESRGIVDMAVGEAKAFGLGKGNITATRSAVALPDDLPPETVVLVESLFPRPGESVTFTQSDRAKLRAAHEAFKKTLGERVLGTLVQNNTRWSLIGAGLSLLVVVVTFLSSGQPVTVFLLVWLSVWTVGVCFLLLQVFKAWREVAQKRGLGKAGALVGAIFISVFATPFVAGELLVLYLLTNIEGPLVPLALLANLICAFVFYRLLRAPTAKGRRILDAIDGYRVYLQHELPEAVALDPVAGEGLYRRHLPWAVALDLEEAWRRRLDAAFGAATEARAGGIRPHHWYHTHVSSAVGGSLGAILGGAMASSTASHSSGGGSSGGGGGGGGGGGW